MKVAIYASDIHPTDAVGNHCIGLARLFRSEGHYVDVFAYSYSPADIEIQPAQMLLDGENRNYDVLLLSHSIFDSLLPKMLRLNVKKIVYYHGITPPALFADFDPFIAELCEKGLEQRQLLNQSDYLIANSAASAEDLRKILGNIAVDIVPPITPHFSIFKQPAQRAEDVSSGDFCLLCVGRVVPHKRIEDALRICHILNTEGLACNLLVVGAMPLPDYASFLFNETRRLNLLQKVSYTGKIDEIDLFRIYRSASALLSSSLHEGFGVPSIEALHFGLPVFARSDSPMAGWLPKETTCEIDTSDAADVPRKFANAILQHVDHGTDVRSSAGNNNALSQILESANGARWNTILNATMLGS